MRHFDSGATRDTAEGKPDYLGFCSALVMRRYGEYMMKHQVQADGETRAADNWKQGIPQEAYEESLGRHFVDAWLEFEGFESREGLEEALCAILFNAQGLLYEILREKVEATTPRPITLGRNDYHYDAATSTYRLGPKDE